MMQKDCVLRMLFVANVSKLCLTVTEIRQGHLTLKKEWGKSLGTVNRA